MSLFSQPVTRLKPVEQDVNNVPTVVPLGVEAMFAQILEVVQRSASRSHSMPQNGVLIGSNVQHNEIAELRQECQDLRHANASLEKQVREGLQVGPCLIHAIGDRL